MMTLRSVVRLAGEVSGAEGGSSGGARRSVAMHGRRRRGLRPRAQHLHVWLRGTQWKQPRTWCSKK